MRHFAGWLLIAWLLAPAACAQQFTYERSSHWKALAGGLGGAGLGVAGWHALQASVEEDDCVDDSDDELSCGLAKVGLQLTLALMPPLLAGGGAAWAAGFGQEQTAVGYAMGGAAVGLLPGYVGGRLLTEDGSGRALVGAALGMGVGAVLGVQVWQHGRAHGRVALTPVVGQRQGMHLRLRF